MIKFSNEMNPEITSFKRFVIRELLKKGFTRSYKKVQRDLYCLNFYRGDQSFQVTGWLGIGIRCTWEDQKSVTSFITNAVDKTLTIIDIQITKETTIEQFFANQRNLISEAIAIINSLE